MSGTCQVCLGDLAAGEGPHPRCARELFGVPHAPKVDLELAKLHAVALAMVGHTTFSGVQRKISVGLDAGRATLRLALEGGQFVLKPQAQSFPHLPENEHVTMRIAAAAGIEIPPCGLVHLADGSLAYVVRRFDRPEAGGKLALEDFCQLAVFSPKQKYEGSAELCARLVRRYATEPGIDALRLFRQIVFAWWAGNGDLHLKNLSLLRTPDGIYRLSPAYDLLSTALVVPDDRLALPVGGNRGEVAPREWIAFGDYCALPRRAARRALEEIRAALEPGLDLVRRSRLPADMQERYAALLRGRTPTIEKAIARAGRGRSGG